MSQLAFQDIQFPHLKVCEVFNIEFQLNVLKKDCG